MSKVVSAVTDFAPTRGVVSILALSLTGWGLWVINPGADTFDNQIYGVMEGVATETGWGLLFVFAGLNLARGVIRKSVDGIKVGALVGWILWLLVSILYGLADPSATMIITNFCLALMHAWIYLQAHIHPELLTGFITIADLKEYQLFKENNND